MDADLLFTHMNNARVFRELDFGRWDHLQRSGLLGILYRTKGWGVVSAQTCRYRRALHMFMMYKIETRPVYYDSNNIYFEQKVISIRDEIVRCLAHVKLAVNLDLDKVIAKHFPDTVKVPAPKDLELYIDYNRVNSERLRVTKKRSKSLTLQEIENDDVNKQGEQLLDT
ncbi:protein THEM6 isoform X2 [Folsomia candida]|nr:protein THEM6 isoform X2 [Folsomia candida]